MNGSIKTKRLGNGIPEYDKSDLMSDNEVFDFGIEVIRNYLKENGFSIKIEIPNSDSVINFLVNKDKITYAIFVKTDIAPNIPNMNEKERKNLCNEASKKDAVPLFASVGFGSVDSERFKAGLALRNDGYYCRFNGFEEISETQTDNNNTKTDNTLIERIAEIYLFDDTSDFGFYNSYRNFCLKNIIRFDFIYGSKNVRVNSTPEEYTLSETKSDTIRKIFKDNFENLVKIESVDLKDIKKYFSIVYVNGDKEYYKYNADFNKIFTCDKSDAINVKPEVISTPYLIFDNNSESKKYNVINQIGICIRNKKFSDIYKYLSDDCTIDFKGLKIFGIDSIKEEIKRRCGFLNSKLKKVKFYNNIMGYLNKNSSDICLKIEYTDEHYNTTKYALFYEFDKNNHIVNIQIKLFDEKAKMKMIFDEGLKKLLNAEYNDFNN